MTRRRLTPPLPIPPPVRKVTPQRPATQARPRRKRMSRRRRQARPQLLFRPPAWAKLLYLRDRGPTEVAAFGISAPDNLLCVEELVLIEQRCTTVSVAFDDVAVAEFFETQVEEGRRPDQFARIWIHTHPGDSATPSSVDHRTFSRVFGECDWAVMAILACGGETHAELHWRAGGPTTLPLEIDVDYSQPFSGTAHADWDAEYDSCVTEESWEMSEVDPFPFLTDLNTTPGDRP